MTAKIYELQCWAHRKIIIMIEQEIIGMEKQAALKVLKEQGLQIRIVSEDGKSFRGTCEYRLDRVNLYIENGKVVKASKG